MSTFRGIRLDSCLSAYTKINSKWIEKLDMKPETLKLLGENNSGIVKDFIDLTPKAQDMEAKIDKLDFTLNLSQKAKKRLQIGFHQTKELLHNKGNNQQSEKTIYRMVENIFKLYTPVKGLMSRIFLKTQ